MRKNSQTAKTQRLRRRAWRRLVREKQDQRPDEIELLFNGEGPEVIERQRGGCAEGVAGEVREVLQEEDEDQQRLELREVSAGKKGGDGRRKNGEEVKREYTEDAARVEVSQAVESVVGLPQAAGDEKAGEGEEKNDAAPAETG